MSSSFDIKLPDNFAALLPNLQRKATSSGFTIEPNGSGYNLRGYGVEGTLEIVGDYAHVVVIDKPFFISDNMIINAITDYLRNLS